MTNSNRLRLFLKRHKLIDWVVDGKTGRYVTSFIAGDGWVCSCPWYVFKQKMCSHIKQVLGELMSYDLNDILKDTTIGQTFDSSLTELNKLFDSPTYNTNEIVAIYGKPGTGKTLLSAQESIFLTCNSKNVLFIDTEGSLIPMLRQWVPKFEKRFGKRTGAMIIENKKTIETLMEYLGYNIVLTYEMKDKKKQKGKLEFKVLESVKPKIEDDINKYDIDFVVLDSVTSPLRSFTYEQQSFPARATATAFILRELVRLQEDHNLGVLVTAHASFNPQNPYETKADMTGGIMTKHYTKRQIYLDRRESKDARDYRRFWLVRGENAPQWTKAGLAKIDNTGYNDSKQEDYTVAFTGTELGHLGLI